MWPAGQQGSVLVLSSANTPGGLPPKEAPRNSKGAGVFGAALTGEVQPGGGGRRFGLVSLHVAG